MKSYQRSKTLKKGSVDSVGKKNFPDLKSNVPGSAVFDLQSDLHKLGFLAPQPDGVFGNNTASAARAFQKAQDLAVDGIAGPQTKATLASEASSSKKSRGTKSLYGYLRNQIERQGFCFTTKLLHLNLLGIRGYWNGQAVSNSFNFYNDTIYAIFRDKNGKENVEEFQASCDPGKQKTGKANPLGVAHLCEGQWFFARGKHAGRYRALRQARKVKVLRLFDNDPGRVKPSEYKGWFGINIHYAGKEQFKEVGSWSAGCQVIKQHHWSRFDQLVYKTGEKSQKQIPYTLMKSQSLSKRTTH